jgi:transposase-like protein
MTILEIRDKLANDEIDYTVAFEQIKKFPKPWHTKDWKTKRDKIIKSECEQCQSKDGVMVAQHLTHPLEFKTIRNEIFNTLFSEVIKSTAFPKPVITNTEIKEFHDKTTKIREACPHCRWIRIRKRKTMKPKYFCESCKVDFEEATTIQYNEIFKTIFPTDEQVITYLAEKMEKEAILDFKRSLYAKHEKEIGKKALLISIDLHLKYTELENVLTFCKRCAAKMDLDQKLLCWTCKTDYFNYQLYECCYQCYERNDIIKNPIKGMICKYRDDYNSYRQQYIGGTARYNDGNAS